MIAISFCIKYLALGEMNLRYSESINTQVCETVWFLLGLKEIKVDQDRSWKLSLEPAVYPPRQFHHDDYHICLTQVNKTLFQKKSWVKQNKIWRMLCSTQTVRKILLSLSLNAFLQLYCITSWLKISSMHLDFCVLSVFCLLKDMQNSLIMK